MEGYCRDVRGRIRLARGDLAGALDDTVRALSQARASNQPQMLCPALAVRARVLASAGDLDEAASIVDELLALWAEMLNLFPVSAWVVDLGARWKLSAARKSFARRQRGSSPDRLAGSRFCTHVEPVPHCSRHVCPNWIAPGRSLRPLAVAQARSEAELDADAPRPRPGVELLRRGGRQRLSPRGGHSLGRMTFRL